MRILLIFCLFGILQLSFAQGFHFEIDPLQGNQNDFGLEELHDGSLLSVIHESEFGSTDGIVRLTRISKTGAQIWSSSVNVKSIRDLDIAFNEDTIALALLSITSLNSPVKLSHYLFDIAGNQISYFEREFEVQRQVELYSDFSVASVSGNTGNFFQDVTLRKFSLSGEILFEIIWSEWVDRFINDGLQISDNDVVTFNFRSNNRNRYIHFSEEGNRSGGCLFPQDEASVIYGIYPVGSEGDRVCLGRDYLFDHQVLFMSDQCDNSWNSEVNFRGLWEYSFDLSDGRISLVTINNQNSPVLSTYDKNGVLNEFATIEDHNFYIEQLLRKHPDGGYYFSGVENEFGSPGPGPGHFITYRLSESGSVIWKRVYGEVAEFQDISGGRVLSDGGLLVQVFRSTLLGYNLIKFGPNGELYKNKVYGSISVDSNDDCIYDSLDVLGNQINILAESFIIGKNNYSSSDGVYTFGYNEDSVQISLVDELLYWDVCPKVATVSFLDTTCKTLNFNLTAVEDCALVTVDVGINRMLRCFDNKLIIDVENIGTKTAKDVKINVELDSFLHPVIWNQDTIVGNNGIYGLMIGDLAVFESKRLNLTYKVSCDAPLGQVHCVSAFSETKSHCDDAPDRINHASASDRMCMENRGSYDPNDKRAFINGDLVERSMPKDSLIRFQVRFQNTGTDTAFNVLILDTLSADFDLTSFRLITSSHDVDISIDENAIVSFNFPNILLPDSTTNLIESNGFVDFFIKHDPSLTYGDIIENRASIYFDFNEPIHTNTVELEIARPASTVNTQPYPLQVFPNPSTGEVTFKVDQYTAQDYIVIRDIYGRLVQKRIPESGSTSFHGLPQGLLFYTYHRGDVRIANGTFIVVVN